MAKPGHSNVYVETLREDDTSGCAMIDLRGGASVLTVHDLPPLALRESDWRTIGEKMGWLHAAVSAKGGA